MTSQVVLVLGAGANIGKSIAQKFANTGFKVAIASRSLDPELVKTVNSSHKVDFSNPASVKDLFASVKAELGVPNVVIYNAHGNTLIPKNPLSIPLSKFEQDLAANTTSVYAAAQEAVAGFDTLPKETLKTFIFTGNRLNIEPMPVLFNMGVGKTATAHLVQAASMAYKNDGYRFYYADERKADGAPVGNVVSGESAAEFYYELSENKSQGPWYATFVGGKGYVDFHEKSG